MFTLPFIFIPLPLIYFGVALQIGGILFSPVAAVWCAWVASSRGFSVWRCALAGAVFSALLFLPWLYLVRRMLGKPLSANIVSVGIHVAFIIWIGFLISQGALLVSNMEGGWPPYRREFTPAPGEWFLWWTLLVTWVVSATCYVSSLRILSRRSRARVGYQQYDDTPDTSPLLTVYLMPFVVLSLHTLIVFPAVIGIMVLGIWP